MGFVLGKEYKLKNPMGHAIDAGMRAKPWVRVVSLNCPQDTGNDGVHHGPVSVVWVGGDYIHWCVSERGEYSPHRDFDIDLGEDSSQTLSCECTKCRGKHEF